jgi:CheY-like chemotaxis protein
MTEGGVVLADRSVLLVEDEPLIALDVCEGLGAAGANVIAGRNVGDALRLIEQAEITAAIVDVRLGADDCSGACRALVSRQIPFVFYTAYSIAPALERWPDVAVVDKPANTREIVAAVAELVKPPLFRSWPRKVRLTAAQMRRVQ